MAIGVTFFIIAISIVVIWLIIEFKRLKHKILAIFLIGLIIFTYISFTVSVKKHDLDLRTVEGLLEGGKIYVAWLSTLLTNTKSITTYASKQDWKEYDEKILEKNLSVDRFLFNETS
ncbi:MAG: hypothetical protein U9Q99_02530 [Nanoarchaeota archaeon]|nr:hypothetical protein [Nanoarchaeota archaeon]